MECGLIDWIIDIAQWLPDWLEQQIKLIDIGCEGGP